MDSSPTATKPTTTASTAVTSIGSPIVQESPFSNYLSNLSPIKPVTTLRVLQGYADLSSPLVFTSPHVVSKCEASSLQSSLASSSETAKYNVGQSCVDAPPDLEKCGSYSSSKFNVVTQKDGDNSSYTKEQLGSSSEFVDEYLSEPVDKECGETVHSENQTTEPSVDPFGLANLQAILLSSDTDKEAPTFELPSTRQGSSNCAQTSDVLLCQTSLVQNMQAKDYYQHVGGGLDDPEVSQLHRGMSRRCLQFEETQGIGQGAMPAMDSSNASSNQMGSIAPFSSVGMENSKMLNPGISAPSTKRKMINLTRGMISIHPPNQNAKATLSIPKRSGIGLHLNSIVKAFPKEYNANETMKSHLEESKGCSTELSNSVENVRTPVGDRMVENQPAPAAVSATPDSMPFMKSLDVMQSVDPNETPHEKRTLSSEHSGSLNEFTQSSPKKKRKKFIPNGDGCKRCNCKKTKCLKLYCDCFAAGIYCADTCSCQGCFNRPEYEDTVLETRQLIESRNPLAFAPKIVHQSSILPPVIGEEVNRATPSSARHKRGCNCKRSMCLKKYCECYQANVGCSSGCRCEGCKNVYGRKDDYCASEEIMGSTTSRDETKDIVDDNLTMVVHSDALLNTDSSDPQSPAPFTPQLQVFKHENGAPKSRPFSSRYLPSPLSDMSTFQSDATTTSSPTQTGDDNNLLADIDCQEMELTIAEMMGELSPKFDPIGDICCLSPQHNAPSSTAAGSPSAPRTMDSSTNVPRPEDGGGRGGLVSSSLRWHGSPVTPMPFSGKSKSQGDGKMSSEAHMREDEEEGEDTTPEILKEACNPIQSVKATSPNKKRVSPPYAPSKCLKLRSIASGGWKKGKFVLTGVPSFPPLTPCLEPKAPTKEQQEQGKSIRSVHCSRARESVSHKDCIVFESAHITGPWYIPEHRIVMQLWAVLWLLEEVVKFERCAAAFNISGRRRSPAI